MLDPGWHHAQGDPAGTVRYWDGVQWLGSAVAPQDRETSGGYDLIPQPESVAPGGHMNPAVVGGPSLGARPATMKRSRGSRSYRLMSTGAVLLVLGIVLGIAGQNLVTYFSSPTEVVGTVTDVREANGRRGRVTFRIEITTEVGQFYAGGRTDTFPPGVRDSLRGNRQMTVTVLYSERTGGMIAIPELNEDRRIVGQWLWIVVAAFAVLLSLLLLADEFSGPFDSFQLVLLLIFLVIGPIASLLLHHVLDIGLTQLWDAP